MTPCTVTEPIAFGPYYTMHTNEISRTEAQEVSKIESAVVQTLHVDTSTEPGRVGTQNIG
jgi:hypothetical protein